MKLQPDRIEDFLSFNDIVSINPEIRAKAEELTDSLAEVDQARAIFEWVRDEIPHSKDIGTETVTCSAAEVFEQRTGICFSKSHLVASMMRYKSIPCGFCYQVFQNTSAIGDQRSTLHGLNAIYLQSTNRWHRVDPRGNRDNTNAEFSINNEVLAFPEMEFMDEVIYASPLSIVVSSLKNAESITSLWSKLPFLPNPAINQV